MVKYGVDILEEEFVVIVNFIDYFIGCLIVLCCGVYIILGFSVLVDIRGVIKCVVK